MFTRGRYIGLIGCLQGSHNAGFIAQCVARLHRQGFIGHKEELWPMALHPTWNKLSGMRTIVRSSGTIKQIFNRPICIQGDALADLMRFVLIGQDDFHIVLDDKVDTVGRLGQRCSIWLGISFLECGQNADSKYWEEFIDVPAWHHIGPAGCLHGSHDAGFIARSTGSQHPQGFLSRDEELEKKKRWLAKKRLQPENFTGADGPMAFGAPAGLENAFQNGVILPNQNPAGKVINVPAQSPHKTRRMLSQDLVGKILADGRWPSLVSTARLTSIVVNKSLHQNDSLGGKMDVNVEKVIDEMPKRSVKEVDGNPWSKKPYIKLDFKEEDKNDGKDGEGVNEIKVKGNVDEGNPVVIEGDGLWKEDGCGGRIYNGKFDRAVVKEFGNIGEMSKFKLAKELKSLGPIKNAPRGTKLETSGLSRGKFTKEEDLFGVKGPGDSAAPGKVEENAKSRRFSPAVRMATLEVFLLPTDLQGIQTADKNRVGNTYRRPFTGDLFRRRFSGGHYRR
ncbi:hypothetical protein MA16_Dca018321 [Dendrobium catenatum]|uniref:Uncharacterized protein n=1 Tax=Dendrobium catenatum TaxID=906689 RepID=A0A2I0WJH2_9ASPA|nr:hypothetical protein MA16_Dca018321 [Dendrobium catenatum]